MFAVGLAGGAADGLKDMNTMQIMEPGAARPVDTWVLCDRCEKWYCEMNTGSIYNDCDVPQELSDQQIDQLHEVHELEEADGGGRGAGGGSGTGNPRVRKHPPVWQLVKRNIYTHRARKQQDEDDIMICQCPRLWGPPDPKVTGCGPNCLNRMLNIECVTDFCPCGERCSNQMFTRREYAQLDVKRAGAKGFGLFSCKDLSAGDFIIEYIGEVLEEEEYLRRKEFFISTGQRHYYFMNVGNGEVIDACRKGGLGRFINHSCDPNCETQKWLVNGELAIGLFAIRDVAAGEELTFDYNFERYGDKPMKCLCGSKNCRGIIGGTQEGVQNVSEAVVPLDADKELEPIMVTEAEGDRALAAILDLEVGLGWERGWSNTMQRRLQALAAAHGLNLEQLSEDEGEEEEEEEVEEAGEPLEKLLQGRQLQQRQRGQQRQQPAAGRQRRRGAALSSDEEISDVSSDEEGSASLLGKPQHPQRVLSDEEGSEAGEVSGGAPAAATTSSGRKASGSGGSPSIKGAAAAAAAAKAARQEEQRRRQQRRKQRQLMEDIGEEGEEVAGALAATLYAAGSRKERILAASRAAKDAARASQQLPLRKRLKKLARAAKAAQGANAAEQAQQEGGSAVGAGGAPAAPATSTASQRSAGALAPRPAGKPSAAGSAGAGTHSVASTSTALAGGGGATAATTAPLIPKRVSSTPSQTAAADRIGGSKARRRSEIDRRLDDMVGPSGKLRDTSPAGVIRFLRLFNLCDIGPTLSKTEEAALQQQEEQEREQHPPPQQHKVRPRPASPASRPTVSWQDRQPQQAEQAQAGQPRQQQQRQNSRSPPAAESGGSPPSEPGLPVAQRQRQEEASPGEQREEGEVTPAGSAGEGTGPSSGQPGPEEPPRQEAAEQWEPSAGEPLRPGDDRREQQQQPQQRSGSPVRYRERGYREQEGVSQPRPGRQQAQRGELSPRQRARLADMSLLLDVILKTNSHSARKEFVKCGILRQLLATIGHNTGTQYKVVLRKVIRVVESLPCVADDFHFTRSAHGSFADLLREMAQHSDFEVRSKAWGLLKQYPVKDCTRPVNDGPWGLSGPSNPQRHSGATGSSRGSRASRGGPQGERHLRDGLLGPVRSPSHRGSLPGPHPDSSALLASPGYPGPSPHRDSHPPSRLGRPPYGGPHGSRQPPHGPPGPDWPPHPHSMPPSGGSRDPPPHPRGESRPWEPSPHRPNSRPLSGGYPGPAPGQRQGGASRTASEGSERDRWRGGSREGQPFGDTATPAGRPAPLPSVEGHRDGGVAGPPLPTPEGGRAAAESIAAALLSSAGAAAAGEAASPTRAASAALGTVPSTRRKRSRWERDDEPTPGGNLMPAAPAERRQVDSQAADGDGGGKAAVEAGADGRPSLLPPGFGGAAALHDSPPPRPPSVLATSHLEGDAVAGAEGAGLLEEAATQDVPGALAEPPRKRSAPTGIARSPAGSRGALRQQEPEAMAVDAAIEVGQADDQGWAHPVGNGTSAHEAAAERWSPLGAAPAENGSARPGWGGDGAGEPLTRVAAQETDHDAWRQQQQQQQPPYGHQRSWQGVTRPQSGTLSDVSRGDSASSGGSQRRQQHQPPTGQPLQLPSPLGPGSLPPATANGGSLGGHAAEADTLHSPLTGGTNPSTSSHSLPGMNGLSAPVPFVGGGRAVEVAQATADSASGRGASFFKVAPIVLEESWDEPVPRFERYVDEMVRARIGKYLQPGHPAQLEYQEAMRLYKKVSSQVVAKEREAFAERQRSGLHKPIVRSKLEGKIREFVRDSVRRLLQHHGRPSGGA
ncbi:hypothetical protein N2152v2_001677 [Parachlorella kessleri]